MAMEREKVEIQNIVSPGHVTRVDKVKYDAMKDALLTALSREQSALTIAEAKQKLLPLLPDDLLAEGRPARSRGQGRAASGKHQTAAPSARLVSRDRAVSARQ